MSCRLYLGSLYYEISAYSVRSNCESLVPCRPHVPPASHCQEEKRVSPEERWTYYSSPFPKMKKRGVMLMPLNIPGCWEDMADEEKQRRLDLDRGTSADLES